MFASGASDGVLAGAGAATPVVDQWVRRKSRWLSRDGLYFSLASGLIVLHGARLVSAGELPSWLLLLVLLAALPAADFVSGLVHWLADSWGHEEMPWVGPRLLKPFRVHHRTNVPLLECATLECLGDTAMIQVPPLLGLLLVPPTGVAGVLTCVIACTALVSLPTNLIHQWAHAPEPPPLARWLQRYGLILSKEAHDRHHRAPHTVAYCVTFGWLNPLLDALRFFRALEWTVTAICGARPRADQTGSHS